MSFPPTYSISRYSQLSTALKELFNTDNVKEKTSISGGCVNKCYRLLLNSKQQIFVKENLSSDFPNLFLSEGEGLLALRDSNSIRIPKVLAVVVEKENASFKAGKQYLLLEYIESRSPTPTFWSDFGQGLAQLHLSNGKRDSSFLQNNGEKSKIDAFGFSANNYIGLTPQINNWNKKWSAFFGEHRLEFQLKLAFDRRLLSKKDIQKARRLILKLDEILISPSFPELVHGDLWSGNIHRDEQGHSVTLDPAVYYGHGEVDLAMTELFGCLPDDFYYGYRSIYPIENGYAERKEIYNLYHLLNHLNLFGRSYYSQCLDIINKFA